MTEITSIYSLLQKQVENNPQAIALQSTDGKAVTYQGLLKQVDYIASTLFALGVHKKDRITLVIPNGIEMAITLLGVSAIATVAPLNPSYTQKEFEIYLGDLKPKFILVESTTKSIIVEVALKLEIPVLELVPSLTREDPIVKITSSNFSGKISDINFTPSGLDDVALVLHTSGTTSVPKIVPLTQKNICTAINSVSQSLNLTKNDRCLNLMPMNHIGGLVDLLLSPLSVGGSVICTPGFSRANFFPWLNTFNPTWFQLVPTMLYELLEPNNLEKNIVKNSSLRFIRSVAAQLSVQLKTQLQDIFSVPIIETYGMTEASPLITTNGLPPAVPKSGSVGRSVGTQIVILDQLGKILPSGDIGEIGLKGDNIMNGYYDNPDANKISFINGWFRTGDLGYLDEEGYLFLQGRVKDIINRGGEKISPWEIDQVLLKHPAIAQAVTFPFPHLTLGEDVIAAVVLQKNQNITNQAIRAYLFEHLVYFKVPSQIAIVTEIPKTNTGKIQRIGLAKKLKNNLIADFVAPHTELEKQLVAIWQKKLNCPSLSINENFFKLGGNSLLAVKLIAEIEEDCGVKLPLSDFFFNPTIAQLSKFLEAQNPLVDIGSVPQSFIPIKIQPETKPLFAIHTLGIGGKYFQTLSESISNSVIGVNYQFQSNLPWSFRTINWFADCYVQDLLVYQQDAPFSLIGYSIGGLCAFEVALRLIKAGRKVQHLILIDTFFPGAQKMADIDQINDHQLTKKWLQKQYYQAINELRYLKYVGKPFSAVPESLQHYVSLRENRKAYRHHQIQTSYPGDLIYIRSTSSRPIHSETWQQWVKGQFICHQVSGLHNELLTSNRVLAIANILNTYI